MTANGTGATSVPSIFTLSSEDRGPSRAGNKPGALNRRTAMTMMTAIAAAPVGISSAGGMFLDVGRDVEIAGAWSELRQAYARYDALPEEDPAPNDHLSRRERREVNIMDASEEMIRSCKATTPEGIATQLWVALLHSLSSKREHEIILTRDLEALKALDIDLDWNERLIVAALRSLEEMTARLE